ncbi:spore germination protein [Fuchsiella alkaliacetigena]|uniref:spore germination protein n=1 Tax=Fuchsiella alkaliacetigena TaxID=957042 RepID=UPI00200AC3F3|nr:spore germination protein [Fuchsiella alkaliacetigena]MCK8825171.1 spore germination protein [Fuchsiella alkaliacetigena]
MKLIAKSVDQNLQYLQKELNADLSFDVLTRTFCVGDKKAGLIFLDGFIKDEFIFIIRKLIETKREDLSVDAIQKIIDQRIPYFEVETIDNLEEAKDQILAGPQILFIEGETEAILIDGRTWIMTAPDEPELEKTTRGPGDGFVETLLFNVQLIRRRLRDPQLITEAFQVGKRSQNDVALVYIKDIANPDLVDKIRDRLKQIDVDGLPMADRTIEDFITGDTLNPLPKIRYTERPDVAVANLLEGKICVMVDNTPTVLLLPAVFFDQLESLEDYRQPPVPGSYLKIIRLLALWVSLFLPPLWLVGALQPELLPEFLEFIGPKEVGAIPIGIQFILASVGIDLMRLASIQTPNALSTSLSLIGALLLGEFAVEVGLFMPETILYMAAGAISTFVIPSFELGLTVKLMRFVLLILVTAFTGVGFIIGTLGIMVLFGFTKSFGTHYMWPLIPFDGDALRSFITRRSILELSVRRPKLNRPVDKDRLPENDTE